MSCAAYYINFFVSGEVLINKDQCIQENGAVTLTCIVTSLSGPVEWYVKSNLKALCGNLADSICFPTPGTEDSRYTFSSVIATGKFTFEIDSASAAADAGDYECVHGGHRASTILAICGKFSLYTLIFMYIYRSAKGFES